MTSNLAFHLIESAKMKLTAIFLADLQPTERLCFESVLDSLADSFEVKRVYLNAGDNAIGRHVRNTNIGWVLTHGWQIVARGLESRPGLKWYVSVLGMENAETAFSSLLWHKWNLQRSTVHFLAHSPLSLRFLREIEGMEADRVSYLPLTLPASELPQPESRFAQRIGVMARLSATCNLNYIVNVAHYVVRKDPSVSFSVIGSGPLLSHYRKTCQEMEVESNVTFGEESSAPHPDLIVYSPLQNFHFLPILYGASRKIPVIASEIPGIDEYIHDGHDGFLVPVYETKPMAELVLRLVGDPILRAAMGRNLYEKILQKFPFVSTVSEFRRIFQGEETISVPQAA